jgi:hypothetical protein
MLETISNMFDYLLEPEEKEKFHFFRQKR